MRRKISSEQPERNDLTSFIDVVFLLLIFFMCATTFKVPEGTLDSFLPRSQGGDGWDGNRPLRIAMAMADSGEVVMWADDVRVPLHASDAPQAAFERRRGLRSPDESVVLEHLRVRQENYTGLGPSGLPVIIDFADDVPSKYVVQVLNLCTRAEVEDVSFARPEMPAE